MSNGNIFMTHGTHSLVKMVDVNHEIRERHVNWDDRSTPQNKIIFSKIRLDLTTGLLLFFSPPSQWAKQQCINVGSTTGHQYSLLAGDNVSPHAIEACKSSTQTKRVATAWKQSRKGNLPLEGFTPLLQFSRSSNYILYSLLWCDQLHSTTVTIF